MHHCQAAPYGTTGMILIETSTCASQRERGHDVKTFFPPGRSRKIYIIFLGAILARGNHEGCFVFDELALGKFVETRDGQKCDEGFFEVTLKNGHVSEVICDTNGSVPGLCS